MAPAATTITTEPRLAAATLLQLAWLASPALPVGAFSYSEGLEAAVEGGHVADEAGAARWLVDQLELGLGRADLPVVAQALAAWRAADFARIEALNDWMRETRESDELRRQGEQMARSLAQWLRNGGCGAPGGAGFTRSVEHLAALRPAPTWPVAFALAAAPSGATASETLLVFAFGWAENAMQAAMKSVPLGQAAAQRVLAQLAQAIPQVVDRALALGDDERQASMPMLAILSARHELQYSRLFRS